MNAKEYLNENNEMLELYTKAITKAHGEHHPEVFEVRELYLAIVEGLTNDEDVSTLFNQLRTLTNEYEVPADVCQTFEKTYEMLEELDKLDKQEG